MRYTLLIVACVLAAACNSNKNEAKDYSKLPAGTLVAADSMQITEDTLNHSWFTVSIATTAKTDKGKYGVKANWGYNPAETEFTLPKGGEAFTPVLRRGTAPYTYMIGFNMKGDTTFYDYFLVEGDRGMIKMRYVKSYSFE